MIKPRAFNIITIDGDTLIKTSSDTTALRNEYNWYSNIPSHLRRFVPEITDGDGSSISMRYIRGRTLHESFVSGEYGIDRWNEILGKIREFTNEMGAYLIYGDFEDSLREMYVDKTRERLMALRDNPAFADFFYLPPVINGTEYPTIPRLIQGLEENVSPLLDCDVFTVIHGDLHFGNIILDDEDNIKVVDPRGKFGEHTIYGDRRYDIAKLYHSIEGGYDYIIDDMYHLEVSGTRIDYSIEPSEYGFDLLSRIRDIFGIEDEADIRLIESLLFLSMIPLHSESPSHQMVMFARGMELYGRATR